MAMFYPQGGGATMFKFPLGRKLRIVGCAAKEDLAKPIEFDSEDECCFIVSKDGNTTDLTIRCYAGLVSFTLNNVGIMSVELGIYNSGSRMLKSSPLRETQAPSSGIQRTAKLTLLGNSTLEKTKAARPVTTLLIAPLAGTSWPRSRSNTRTPTSTALPGKLEGLSLSSASSFRTHS
jgi:hypothetical protein